MKILELIKQNKTLTFFSLCAVVLLIVLVVGLSRSSNNQSQNPSVIPTPTRVPNINPQPTIPPYVQEVPEDFPKEDVWSIQLPVKNPYYYLEYDGPTKTVTARLYPIDSLTVPKNDQVEYLKGRVQEKLKELGADLKKITIKWIVE